MNRREALSTVALLLGGTIIGSEAFLSGCSTGVPRSTGFLSADNIALMDEVGETILPTTATSPGAKATKIGEFMNTMVTDCYEKKDQAIFADGIVKLNAASQSAYQKSFIDLSPDQKTELLVRLDTEAKEYTKKKKDAKDEKAPEHYFTMFKQLTVMGYFTSKEGATKALRYVAVPGHYDGDVPYKKGDKAWATS